MQIDVVLMDVKKSSLRFTFEITIVRSLFTVSKRNDTLMDQYIGLKIILLELIKLYIRGVKDAACELDLVCRAL